ncbi:MAG TPA: hypothetical protein VNH22_12670 [Blastocatellia bacterium]|jgi:tetratricopeptide (TPR) repeat protein|nr:hypothetical protein [Blastocatellia bacterium]
MKNAKVFLPVAAVVLLFTSGFAGTRARGAQADQLAKGTVIAKVICKADAKQSYALYLPSNYTAEKRWPVLYCFDPAGRGARPVERFKDAAEKYGYIVAGSNNSRNGPNQPVLASIAAMWDDTHARFSIDKGRVYTTGHSGGARVAMRAGLMCKSCVTGVIANGAGFPPDIPPSASTSFIIYGMLGIDDFNFPELKRLDETLAGLGITHRVEFFEGPHQWAPKESCTEAIEWMEVQAMKAGRREKDAAMIRELFETRVAKARGLEEAGKAYESYLAQAAIAEDFKGLIDVSDIERKVAGLGESKEVRQAAKDEREQVRRQLKYAEEIKAIGRRFLNPLERNDALLELRRISADLQKRSKVPEDTGDRRVARRTINQVYAELFESALYLYRNEPDLMVINLEVASELTPGYSHVFYELACAYSLKGDKKKAIETLKKSLDKGFKDIATIESDERLAAIRQEPEYKRLIEGLKK